MTQQPIYFKQLELGPMQNFIYLIGDPDTREAAVVDPGWEIPRVLRTAEDDGYRMTKTVLTHHHFDHVMGLGELLKAVDVPVYVHRKDAPQIRVEPRSLKQVSGGESINIGNLSFQLIHTPGHTPGSQCVLVDGRLLSGDTLFIHGCGRCDLPGGDPRVMFDSLSNTLKALDDSTTLYPGHNYAETPTARLGDEKHSNPFLAAPTQQDFLRLTGFA